LIDRLSDETYRAGSWLPVFEPPPRPGAINHGPKPLLHHRAGA